jgi:thymidylate synthase ThyX
MTTITAEILADSVNRNGNRITTLKLCYPRYIHSEFMTHRVFSRNAQSSRAVPSKAMRKSVNSNPAEPIFWGANEKGMQSHTELNERKKWMAQFIWGYHRKVTLMTCWLLDKVGAHKQLSNRLLEPHNHIWVIVTSTDWANFIALRDHPAAEPSMQALAEEIKYNLDSHEPTLLEDGQWHLPMVRSHERASLALDLQIKVSVARCARISYTTFENRGRDSETVQDIALYNRLLGSQPIHASPAEHQARADAGLQHVDQWGNFKGWVQYRKTVVGECILDKPYKSVDSFSISLSQPNHVPVIGIGDDN